MSGGHFGYTYQRIANFVEELDASFLERDEEGELKYLFCSEVLAKIYEIRKNATKMAGFMREVEWLFSGDSGEETFMRAIKEIEDGKS